MAMVLLCGHPCSGKSTAAAEVVRAIESSRSEQATASDSRKSQPRPEASLQIRVLDDSALPATRDEAYTDTSSEKKLRGALRSEVDRVAGGNCIVLVDSLNHIKGYRYELWCIARAAGLRFCTLLCDVPPDVCCAWNQERARERGGADSYSETIMSDLTRRFEPPVASNRWDSPLFVLRPHEDPPTHRQAVVSQVASLALGLTQQQHGTRAGAALQPTVATQAPTTGDSNLLFLLDKATKDVVAMVREQSANAPMDAPISFSIHPSLPLIDLPRSASLPELQRHRRSFLRLTGASSLSGPAAPKDAAQARQRFAQYLVQQLS